MLKKIIVLSIILFLLLNNSCMGQSNTYVFEQERINTVDTSLNWYAIANDYNFKKIIPIITKLHDAEMGWEGNTIISNEYPYPTIIMIGSQKKHESKQFEQPQKIRYLESGDTIKISTNYELSAKEIISSQEKFFSLWIRNIQKDIDYEVFRNCRMIDSVQTYFGCARMPFRIDFIGDINNDSFPEIILSADKEASVLKLVISQEKGIYKVVKWTEFE